MRPPRIPERAPPGSAAPHTRLAQACYLALGLTGWLVVSAACVAGLWALFFVLLGEFSFAGTLLHLDNFAARYLAADAARAAQFRETFWLASAAGFLVVGLLRARALVGLAADLKERR
jgi:hypothetical protein